MTVDEREIGLEDIVIILQKNYKTIFIPCIIATLLSLLYFLIIPSTYESYSFIRLGSSGGVPFETQSNIKDIMYSLPILKEMAKKANGTEDSYSEFSTIRYEDANGLLKVVARSNSPEKAQKIVGIASEQIIARHQILYNESRRQLNDIVQFIKNTVKPVPLSSAIGEFKAQSTEIVIPPILDNKPIKPKTVIKSLAVFFITFFVCSIIILYKEGRRHSSI